MRVNIGQKAVEVVADASLGADDVAAAIASAPFQNWLKKMATQKKFVVERIRFQSVDYFGSKKVGFIKFVAQAVNELGKFIPGIVFMRGGSVGVLFIMSCEGVDYTVLTLQPRMPIAQYDFPEIPAGMLDGEGHFAGVAAKEIEEECGISIDSKDLVDMTELTYGSRYPGMFPSAGGCDEFVRLFLYRCNITRERLDGLKGKLTGCLHEGEMITLKIIPFDELWKEAPDAKSLSSLALYNNLSAAGSLPESERASIA